MGTWSTAPAGARNDGSQHGTGAFDFSVRTAADILALAFVQFLNGGWAGVDCLLSAGFTNDGLDRTLLH